MENLPLQDIKTEGNSIFITTYPTTGVLALLGFTEDVSGVDGTHTFDKSFRFTIDGVHYSEWLPLTTLNITSIDAQPHQIICFELQYYKNQPLGEDQLEVNDISLQYNQENISSANSFDNTIFKTFFESNDIRVLNWYVNVLNKLYQKGLIADYIVRNQGQSDEDFLQLWGTVAKFFAYYVVYARQFQNFHQSEALLFEFLEQRGLKISKTTTLEQMNTLMEQFYIEISKRGTFRIVDKEEDGATVDGELLRLLWYNQDEDEFIFNPRLPQHIGWNLGNSSPLYRGLYLHDNANKTPEKQLYPKEISHYTGAVISVDEGHNVLSFDNLTLVNSIKVDSNLDYQLSFLIKTASPITVSIQAFDKEDNPINTFSYKDNSITNYFLNNAGLSRSDKYLPISLILYNANKPIFSEDLTSINQGNDLKLHLDVVRINIFISTSAGLLYGLRLLPLTTPYSHGLIQTNNVIDCFAINNNHYYTFKQLHNHIARYLIPYNSHLFLLNIQEFTQQTQEEVIR